MICKNCGEMNDSLSKFCTNCSQPLYDEHEFDYNPPPPPPPTQIANASGPNQSYYRPPYNQPPNYAGPLVDEHVSVGNWIGIFCINLIPCVGPIIYLVMLFVWAFGSTPKKSLKNYARAQLLIAAILLGIVIIVIIIAVAIASASGGSYRSSRPYYNW